MLMPPSTTGFRPPTALLLLIALTLSACATSLPASQPLTPQTPAVLMSDDTETSWRDYSERARAWLKKASQQATGLK